MIYAETAAEVKKKRKTFLRKWRLKCKAVADSQVGEGGPWPRWGRASPLNGDRLFTFTRLDPAQWKAARTTDAIDTHPIWHVSPLNARRARSHQAARSENGGAKLGHGSGGIVLLRAA